MNSINIGVIVDRSGSVENEKIPLEDSINLLMESFKRKYLENTSLRLLLIILENNDILIQEKDFKNVFLEKIELKNDDIEEALKMIEEKFKNYEGDKKVILFSDGYLNDKNNSFLNEKNRSTDDEIERISVGIGEGYRKNVLEKFSTSGIVFEYQDIGELNTAIRDMLGTLKEQESLKAEIYISFITFGKGGANLHTALTPVSDIEFNDFTVGGLTPLGGALRIAKDMIENREIIKSKSYTPIILLLSDGAPNDNGWENEMHRFINDGRSQKCMRMSLGIGRDYDYDVLKRFSSSGEVYEAKDSTNIIDFFKFMTMTIKEKTLSTDFNATDFIKGINEDYKKIVKDRN